MSAPSLENEIKVALKTGKVIIGARKSLRAIKLGKAKVVILADKIPKSLEKDVEYYCKLGNIPVLRFKGTSYELGTVCGKPFPITTLAVVDVGSSNLLSLAKGEELA